MEEELNHLVREGILEPVEISDWASPIVPVLKSDGKVSDLIQPTRVFQ